MILITSGAYVDQDLVNDLGLLPPSFLPVANKRLFELQVSELRRWSKEEDIFLSLPVDFEMDREDFRLLQQLGVELVYVSHELSLGESIRVALAKIWGGCGPLSILHGDTLILNSDEPSLDSLSVHENHGYYKRAGVMLLGNQEFVTIARNHWTFNNQSVSSGFFSFSSPNELINALTSCDNDFVKALGLYSSLTPLRANSSGHWLDFGHLNSFYQSRAVLTTERAFNSLNISGGVVAKFSETMQSKTMCEARWYEELPERLRLYTPQFLGRSASGYKLEYLHLLPLSDLFVYGRLTPRVWHMIFGKLQRMLDDFSAESTLIESSTYLSDAKHLYLPKTLDRLEQHYEISSATERAYELGDSVIAGKLDLRRIACEVVKYIPDPTVNDLGVVHGDLCFSNILFDVRSESIKCIDPRGHLSGYEPTNIGDRRYDLAKLYHSVVAGYDFAISGRYGAISHHPEFNGEGNSLETIRGLFKDTVLKPSGYDVTEIHAICTLLFLSMIPLHSDSPKRQEAFIQIGVSLAEELFSGELE